MKCLSLLATTLVGLAITVTHTLAAECTTEQLATIKTETAGVDLTTACAAVASIITSGSPTSDGARQVCADTACMAAMAKLNAHQPDCTVQGVNLQTDAMEKLLKRQTTCKTLGVDLTSSADGASSTPAPVSSSPSPSPSSSPTSSPSPSTVTTSSASTMAVGVSATLLAAVAGLQL